MIHTKEKVKVPRSLRTARLSVVKNKISTPVGIPTHHQAVLATPKKVIKALYDYQAQSPMELSFMRGDFFHVTGRENDSHWYEACNPITNSRGVVPVSYFQVLEKNGRSNDQPPSPQQQHQPPMPLPQAQQPQPQAQPSQAAKALQEFDDYQLPGKKMAPLYGVVLYDFHAERSDELEAKSGEPIIVIAQSNQEWFVAKPIGRLGGPGLIPVSFVEIRDAVTGQTIMNVDDLMQSPTIPKVEEWKKMTQGYDTASISLDDNHVPRSHSSSGSSFDSQRQHQRQPQPNPSTSNSQYPPHHHGHYEEPPHPHQTKPSSSEPLVVAAHMDSYIVESDQYWFIVYARLNNGKHRILYRLYEDFYDFQVNLLHEFPSEAGKEDGERILPYMPGPLTQVSEDVTLERQRDLDKYCQELLTLPSYISHNNLVQQQLFGIHEGDVETDQDPRQDAPKSTTPAAVVPPTIAEHPQESQPMTAQNTQSSVNSNSTIKVKIIHQDEIIAIKVPTNSTLSSLCAKIYDRLGKELPLRYRSETTKERLPLATDVDMEEAFAMAIQVGKLTVYAED
ncbi:hypothetical protein DM01DRAFT_1336750 [Hesseltinella vesiculosa]|uniref:Phox-like protein n=1 Tax=Hesseltinella vesiculosa TaxID=101127 RepID=A0A1X2GF56_9FUNG|nr:hypothetical protein DM01DRAFT_1336750 [Hesseltinella vesiculosa]